MPYVFAPGCAFMLYRPDLARRIHTFLNEAVDTMPEHLTCCRHDPRLPSGTRVVNVCAGCDRRYRELYEGVSTVSLWELLAESHSFPFPDYQGQAMTILDACPTRGEDRIHVAIRTLLGWMNIRLQEPRHTRTTGTCCGDSFYGLIPVDKVTAQMRKRADEMPCEDVVVHCVSCIKAMFIGRKRPRYLIDLLFGEETTAGVHDPDAWHAQLQAFSDAH